MYKARDTGYAGAQPAPGQVAEANRRMRGAAVSEIHGPFIHAPVWSWEVATYFWFGGMASGAAFVALACDTAGDHRSAAIARKVVLGAVAPAPVLLIADLGRPERFLNMMRIFKPPSPMNTGAWCLVAFSGSGALAVAADLGRRAKAARAGALTALFGGYLGSYTGVLLACTAVPGVGAQRTMLGPAFVATATATGAAATRLVLVASGLPHGDRRALGAIETGSMLTELSLSALGERRLGDAAEALRTGRPGIYVRTAKSLVALGISLRLIARRAGPREHELASFMYLAAGLAFRLACVSAGKPPRRTTQSWPRWLVAGGHGRRPRGSGAAARRVGPPPPTTDTRHRKKGLRRDHQAHQPRDRASATALAQGRVRPQRSTHSSPTSHGLLNHRRVRGPDRPTPQPPANHGPTKN